MNVTHIVCLEQERAIFWKLLHAWSIKFPCFEGNYFKKKYALGIHPCSVEGKVRLALFLVVGSCLEDTTLALVWQLSEILSNICKREAEILCIPYYLVIIFIYLFLGFFDPGESLPY